MGKYKDMCDNCKKFGYCKGIYGKVLCENCIKEYEKNVPLKKEENNEKKGIIKGQLKFII